MNLDINNLKLQYTDMQQLFEEIALKSNKLDIQRQCRAMDVPDNINELEPGQYCLLNVEGGGYYCQWYYYYTLNKRHILIFRSPNDSECGFSYSGREIDEIPISFTPYCNLNSRSGSSKSSSSEFIPSPTSAFTATSTSTTDFATIFTSATTSASDSASTTSATS